MRPNKASRVISVQTRPLRHLTVHDSLRETPLRRERPAPGDNSSGRQIARFLLSLRSSYVLRRADGREEKVAPALKAYWASDAREAQTLSSHCPRVFWVNFLRRKKIFKKRKLLKTVNINLGMFSQNAYKFSLVVSIDIQKLVSQCSRKQKILVNIE